MKCAVCKQMLILTDLQMPYMDGIELAKELKKMEKAPEFTYNLKIVLVSNEE